MRAPPSNRATSTPGHLGSYYSAALLQGGVRVLGDGTNLNQTGSFYLAARPYVEANGTFISRIDGADRPMHSPAATGHKA